MVKSKLFPSLLLVGALAVGFASTPAQAQLNLGSGLVIEDIDLDLNDLELVDGVLQLVDGATATVSGTIAGLPFTTTITDFALELLPDGGGAGEACSVLHLELAPIDLNLLGLFVDTSPICLDITAMEGGGLLGDLLCGLAGGNLLDLGRLLDGVLADGLTDILNTGLGRGQQGAAAQQLPGAEDICDGTFPILDLAVGPIDLNLLGLVVELDDCTGGPVQVCVSASRGQGLLGDLLVGLLGGGLLDLGDLLDLGNLEDLLGAIADGLGFDSIGDLIDAILDGLNPAANQQEVGKLSKEISKALRDGQLSDNELAKVTRGIAKATR